LLSPVAELGGWLSDTSRWTAAGSRRPIRSPVSSALGVLSGIWRDPRTCL